jgi:CO/xanthine dehydrogenase Mo-binding subunit
MIKLNLYIRLVNFCQRLKMSTNYKWIGKPIPRLEDPPLITGIATFIDDVQFPEMLYVAVLRSPFPHARIKEIKVERVLRRAGVKGVLLPNEVVEKSRPIPPARTIVNFNSEEYCLAFQKTRCVGEPIVAVAATSQSLALDALEDVEVEYDVLKPVVDPEQALVDNTNLVFESYKTNLVAHFSEKWGDVDSAFRTADKVLNMEFNLHRYSFTPLETIGVIANYDTYSHRLTIWANVQMVGEALKTISYCLGIPTNMIRLIVPNIGGGFGLKGRPWKNILIASLLSMKTGKPVKFVETRREHLASAGHTPAINFKISVAVKNNGRILGYKIREIIDEGASISYAGIYALMHKTLINGPYDVRNIEWDAYCVLTNKEPSTPVRAVGKAGIGYVLERMMDRVARELSLDPSDVRFRNYIKMVDMPYVTPSGKIYDPSDYEKILKKALEIVEYEQLRQKRGKVHNTVYGIGISTTLHGGSAWVNEFEAMQIVVDPHGRIRVICPSPDLGTGQRTSLAQIVAEELGVSPQSVSFPDIYFDSQTMVWTPFSGTHASKFSGPDVEAAAKAARIIKEKIIKIASKILEANPEDLMLEDGDVVVKGTNIRLSFEEMARFVYQHPSKLPEGIEPGLSAICIEGSRRSHTAYVTDPTASYLTYPFSAHVAVVELDVETGNIRINRYVVVHDCGTVINPMIVEGQVTGAVNNGIEAATMSEFIYNEDGQLVNQTFADYLVASSCEAVSVQSYTMQYPTDRSIYGVKGIGEADVIGPLAAIPNAIEDALHSIGIKANINGLPITPEKIYKLLKTSVNCYV